jgi:hypothetical protein
MGLYGNGDVGIGTTNPQAKLDVNGNLLLHGVNTNSAPSLVNAALELFAGRSALGALLSGQTTADVAFDYGGSGGGYRHWIITKHNSAVDAGNAIEFFINTSQSAGGSSVPGTGNIRTMGLYGDGSVTIGTLYPVTFQPVTNGIKLNMTANSEIDVANLQIGVMSAPVIQTTAGAGALYLNRDFDNDVLVGTVNGTHGLQVRGSAGSMSNFAGNVTVGGTISANYQDVAEWVPAVGSLPAGTVVIQSDEINNAVLASTRAYDTRVAGIVSPMPGLLLGKAGPGKARIATTGRVRVRADATSAPIRRGDLLVTSDRPGVAMKSQPLDLGGIEVHRPGTLIGKALEPLPSGEGEILVLLSLQ